MPGNGVIYIQTTLSPVLMHASEQASPVYHQDTDGARGGGAGAEEGELKLDPSLRHTTQATSHWHL